MGCLEIKEGFAQQRVLHVAIAGVPNAGKSTLVNYMVGDKVSAVSPRQHTTRENTLGVMTSGDAQVYFHDTPGFISHHDRARYRRSLSGAANDAIGLVDVTLLVVDASRRLSDLVLVSLYGLLERGLRSPGQLALVLNKVDLVHPKERLLKTTDQLMDRAQRMMDAIDAERDAKDAEPIKPDPLTPAGTVAAPEVKRYRDAGLVDDHIEVFMVSAKSGDGVEDVMDYLTRRARPGRWEFRGGTTTNQADEVRANEIVRESLYFHLYKEIPYVVKQHTRVLRRCRDGSVYLEQDLCLERESQKGVVVGKLRFIHKDVVPELTKLFGCDVKVRFNVLVNKASYAEALFE